MEDVRPETAPSSMTPMLPESKIPELKILAAELLRKSAVLTGAFNPVTRSAAANLIGPMNSYYSNLIEGHSTHPLDIDKALKKDYSADPKKKLLQLESRAHVLVNNVVKKKAAEISTPFDEQFICWIHEAFYREMPEELKTITLKDNRKLTITPGALRKIEVEVGRHTAPSSGNLQEFMKFFVSAYSYDKVNDPLLRIIAIAAAHHRLAWIHPFPDGNERVVRLFSEACFIKEKVDGFGLWSISRGLAVRNKDYYAYLNNADLKRRDDYDGHGNLSDRYLAEFCIFFLETAIDQVNFMHSLLEPDALLARVKSFVDLMVIRKKLKRESVHIIEEAILKGKLIRGDMPRITGKSENVARAIMNDLIEEELLVKESDELRSPVRINFPLRYAPYFFPRLYPGDIEATLVA